eukprot:SAG11_NODE_1260_length_5357_cov_3.137505_1_plen_31_part_00
MILEGRGIFIKLYMYLILIVPIRSTLKRSS